MDLSNEQARSAWICLNLFTLNVTFGIIGFVEDQLDRATYSIPFWLISTRSYDSDTAWLVRAPTLPRSGFVPPVTVSFFDY